MVGDVEYASHGLAASSGDLTDQFLQLFLIAGGDGDSHTCGGELERAGSPNTLRRAGDERHSS